MASKKIDPLITVKTYNSVGGPAISIRLESSSIYGHKQTIAIQARDAKKLARWILKTLEKKK